ncbi:hypothetical protein HA466_0193390 [Hirschfeldia incana]|nr:hypothetical protein HA466_0193390 [Hirschfeldia incana]
MISAEFTFGVCFLSLCIVHTSRGKSIRGRRRLMSGLYNNNSSYFSPARAASPQIRSTPEIDSSQYLTELLAEHQKLTPFMQVLPICSRLLNQEMFRVSGMMPNQGGFGNFDRLRHRSPSPMASSNLMSNVSNSGLGGGGWNGALSQVVGIVTKACVKTLSLDESQDFIKRQQLRELALLNSNNLREESAGPSGGGSRLCSQRYDLERILCSWITIVSPKIRKRYCNGELGCSGSISSFILDSSNKTSKVLFLCETKRRLLRSSVGIGWATEQREEEEVSREEDSTQADKTNSKVNVRELAYCLRAAKPADYVDAVLKENWFHFFRFIQNKFCKGDVYI